MVKGVGLKVQAGAFLVQKLAVHGSGHIGLVSGSAAWPQAEADPA